jgi:hypothetical protein
MHQPSQTKPTLQNRLVAQAVHLKNEANALPHGPLRDAAIRKARQTETALAIIIRSEHMVMSEYRAYLVGLDGRFIGFEPIISADDAEATEKAKRLVNGHDVELWSGTRMVVRLHHQSPTEMI